MMTTIKIDTETKQRLLKLNNAKKGKSFNAQILELILFYENNNKAYTKAIASYTEQLDLYKQSMKAYDQQVSTAKAEKKTWDKLLLWAKSKGFRE